ncbi:choice-of-anchor D domain-containing protein [Salinimonas chungwhensis]|uniref:choice-of-anchor D domain-containing protein n=1 Tax=Salinimonas chungwhensis TaxID=265425 RepID=UPI00037EF6C9|nr:choice-of-anchor D domain-containing protein [Salinimonas chungwhensis]
MYNWQHHLFLLVILCSGRAATADVIYQSDFQTGNYANWTATGDGNDAINLYQGNYSIRHDGLRTLTLEVSTQAYQNVALTMDVAATGLVAGDTCFAEVSVDGGANWQSLGSVGTGQSGGVFSSFSLNSGLDNIAQLRLRFRAYTLYGHYCYADNVTLTGESTSQGAVFEETFQDGEYGNWQLNGNGNDTANVYQGNYSLRLDGVRQATYTVSTQNYQNVSLSADLAGLYLVAGDACYIEYSDNDGATWQVLTSIVNGQDNGSFTTGTENNGLDNLASLHVRFRAYTLFGNYCYGDNVLLTGTPAITSGPALAVSGNTNFGQVAVGQTSQTALTVTNTGDAALVLANLSGLSTPFALISDNCSGQTLTPSSSCQATATFTPATDGTQSATLTLPSNAMTSPDSVTFSGTGVTAQACDFDCLDGSGNISRSALTYSVLTGSTPVSLVDFSQYGVPEEAANPSNTLEGSLSLTVTPGTLTEQGTNLASAYTNPNSLPPFDFTFVQYGTHLLPSERQVVNTGHTAWEWVLLPGRVWDEAGDNGYSRVALPFALQEINANCTHNGVMTFLFKDDGSVSDVAYQVAQETCEYFKYNLHGKVDADYTPGTVAERDAIISDYVQEYANRLPVKPLSALATDYPSAGISVTGIGSDQSASHLTAYGVLYNGTHYRGACQTRFGEYPYCDVMALPSYSTAKTVVAGLGVMRAEQRYGGSQQNIAISDYVTACSGSQWQDVTLLNALDMATGNYDASGDSVDEGAQKTVSDFFLVDTHADKISHSCGYSRKAAPGTQFVYHTSDTYIVSRTLQQYHEQQAGSGADYFNDLLVSDIYKPLNLSPLSYQSKRTYDNELQVWGGYGLTLTGDDLAKLGKFMGQDNGKINGQTVLDASLLADALQQTSNTGLNAGTASRYQHSVWAYDLSASTQVTCSTPTWLPYMSGFGGIGVVMLPNDMVYYYVSDNNEYGFTKTIRELEKISPVCGR